VFVDADLCVGADDIEGCFAALERGDADVAYGTRAHPESALDRSQPGYRVLSGRVFNLLLRGLSLTEERDTQCGLKGFTAAATDVAVAPLVTERFAFDVEALARAERAGLAVRPVPVRWSHVEASRVRPVVDGIDMARAALRIHAQLRREARERTRRPEPMAIEAIQAMAEVERDHWWFRAKHQLVLEELERHHVRGTVVDVGAGTGGLLEELRAAGHPAVGAELDAVALELAGRLDPRPPLVRSVAEAVPLRSGGAAAVTALDLIEHLDDDVAGLRELGRIAGPHGLVVVAVPAYRWAWSAHDERLGHRRRYDRESLLSAAHRAGLEPLRCTHFHSWLVPAAFAMRRTPLRRLQRGSAEEQSMGSPLVNRALQLVTRVERGWLARRQLGLGLSILLVARPRP
jgi:SAM-dependent methyltransferase